jgi:asparagine synthase (glutamine-hydrolysing)
MFHAYLLAARHRKVILTGDGGDEIFAGYDRYYGFGRVGLYAALPEPLRRLVLGPLLRMAPDAAGYKNLTQKARWLHQLSFHKGGRRYAEATAFFRFSEDAKNGFYTSDTFRKIQGRDATECIVKGFDSALADNDLDRMLSADCVTRLPEHSLMQGDRMSMAHGVETRSPFLDHVLAEYVASLPANLKLNGSQLKYLMRRVSEDYLPESICKRPKQGFMFPLGYWMKGPLAQVLRYLIDNLMIVEAGIFRKEPISQLFEEHLANVADHHVRLWLILSVEVWYRMYFEGQSIEEIQGLFESCLRDSGAGAEAVVSAAHQ